METVGIETLGRLDGSQPDTLPVTFENIPPDAFVGLREKEAKAWKKALDIGVSKRHCIIQTFNLHHITFYDCIPSTKHSESQIQNFVDVVSFSRFEFRIIDLLVRKIVHINGFFSVFLFGPISLLFFLFPYNSVSLRMA